MMPHSDRNSAMARLEEVISRYATTRNLPLAAEKKSRIAAEMYIYMLKQSVGIDEAVERLEQLISMACTEPQNGGNNKTAA